MSNPAEPSAASNSRWIKTISTHGNIRGVAIQATDLVREMSRLHGLKGVGSQALGEAAVASLLISSYCKAGERINLNIRGTGYVSQALVDAYPDGRLRGYVVEREHEDGEAVRVFQGGPWGEGLLSVLKTKDQEGEQPYIGTVPLLTGHLAQDLTFYWVQSEQVPSAVGIQVEIEKGEVAAAGGFLIQAMPGASPAEVKLIEEHIQGLSTLAGEFTRTAEPLSVLSRIFQSTPIVVVEERPLSFQCQCSWDRVRRSLVLVGVAELKAMLAEDHQATVRCDFCAKEYSVDEAELQKLIDATKRGRRDDLH